MQHKYIFNIVKTDSWKDYKYIDLIATNELDKHFSFTVRMVRGSILLVSDWIFKEDMDDLIECAIINQLEDHFIKTHLN